MISGASYIVSSLVIYALISWSCGRQSSNPAEVSTFRYPVLLCNLLLFSTAIWMLAAFVVIRTAKPGLDLKVASYFALGFILIAAMVTLGSIFMRRFFVCVRDNEVEWVSPFGTKRIALAQVTEIKISRRSNGLERIAIHADGKTVFSISSLIDDYLEFRELLKSKARNLSIRYSVS